MRTDTTSCRSFTLIELLVVVAIISILAAIALPNFLHAQTKAKVARVQADLRALSTAFMMYRLDNNAYPPVPVIDGEGITASDAYKPLMEPVSYIREAAHDPFQEGIKSPSAYHDGAFLYWGDITFRTDGDGIKYQFVRRIWLQSFGPDRCEDGIDPPFFYHSSNGLISKGDIIYDSQTSKING